jgi:EAL domain-containing protein (putative c-di-GMP-specific phosphodiesterase class I)
MALAQLRSWADEGCLLTVSVNVSPSNLVDEEFPDEVAGRCAGTASLRPRWSSR